MFRQILDVGTRHRGVKERPPVFFLRDEDKAGEFLLPVLIPHQHLYNVLVELLGLGVLAGELSVRPSEVNRQTRLYPGLFRLRNFDYKSAGL
jgi:hypothetical protein